MCVGKASCGWFAEIAQGELDIGSKHKKKVENLFKKKIENKNLGQCFELSFLTVWEKPWLESLSGGAKDMKGHSHTITIPKSALTLPDLWVITVLSLECFVLRLACSISKTSNHSLFTV